MTGISTAPGRYCELHAHSCFSLLDGVPFPEELAERAAALGLPALALTDHDALYSVVPFYLRARALGVKPILGAEMTMVANDDEEPYGNVEAWKHGRRMIEVASQRTTVGRMTSTLPYLHTTTHLTLLSATAAGYQNLSRLVTLSRAGRPKGEAGLPWAALPAHAEGLLCLTGCRQGPVARAWLEGQPALGHQALDHLVEIFGPANVYVELQRNLARDDRRLSLWLASLARERGLQCVATGNVHYLAREDAPLQDVLVSIRERVPLPQAGRRLRPNHEYFLRTPAAMAALYRDLPEALANTFAVAERCNVELPTGLQVLPAFPAPPGLTAQAYLRQICLAAMPRLYPRDPSRAQALLEKELGLIDQLGLANYFLIVWDIVNFCRRSRILCHGRGSAANSLVAHLLGISAVDPIAQGLVVERFLSVEHGGTPDIDLDIDAARRETVIQYVYERWGRDHAAMACTYVTFRSASAIRDAGFALGFKAETIEQLAAAMESERRQHVPDADGRLEPPDVALSEIAAHLGAPGNPDDGRPATSASPSNRSGGFNRARFWGQRKAAELASPPVGAVFNRDPQAAPTPATTPAPLPNGPSAFRLHSSSFSSSEWQRLITLASRLQKRPRHLGLHNGGMVVTGAEIGGLIPVEPATMENRTVVQFDKDYLEQLGLVKIDLLGLRMLSAIADAVELVAQGRRIHLELDRLDFRDRVVYDQICTAQTIGIFQVESGAQVSVIPQMQPRCFQDLVIEISLIRPGPLQGNMVRPFLRRRQGLEPVVYPHPALKPALQETLGVIVFQEQVIKIARDFAGLTAGRGEVLRRALGHKHAAEELLKFKDEFIQNALANPTITYALAEQVWQMIANFAGYSFSKAHAAAFAVIVYWSAWLRVHYPVEYFCGLLRNAPLGTYPANVLESEARRVGVKFLPFDINHSLAKATVEPCGGVGVWEHGSGSESRSSVVGRRSSFFLRFGLDYVHGIGPDRAEAIIALRAEGPFRSLADFVQRACTPPAGLDRRAVEALILAGAFDAFGERRQLLWDLAEAFDLARRPAPQLALDIPDERAVMPPMTAEQKLLRTFAATGVTAGMHLVEIRRDAFARAGCLSYRELQKQRPGTRVRAGGLVADGLRRPPTANGTSFIRLEDSDGLVDVIVPPQVYAECRAALRQVFIVVEGTLRRNGRVLSVLAQTISALP